MNKDMYLIRAVEMATIAAYKFIGRKNKNVLTLLLLKQWQLC
ncbi:MAG: hypothetical protein PPFGHCPK_00350 [Spiroplasma endosymbiont of Drosophila atripex]|nr:MAG: hypothetical protein PPFGHCPK_00350 [Spiroplasma endosymbiont of Drosophila atripex]